MVRGEGEGKGEVRRGGDGGRSVDGEGSRVEGVDGSEEGTGGEGLEGWFWSVRRIRVSFAWDVDVGGSVGVDGSGMKITSGEEGGDKGMGGGGQRVGSEE